MINRSPANTSEKFATLLSVALILIVVAVLYFAREIFIPLTLALLFSFLLTPLVTRFERWHLPRVPAVLLAVFLAFCVVGGVGYLVGGQVVELTYKLPSYKETISRRIAYFKSSGHNPLSEATRTVKELGDQFSNTTAEPSGGRPDAPTSTGKDKVVPVEIVEPASSLTSIAQSVVGPLLGPLGTAAIVVVFVLFMLIKREDLRNRIIHLIGGGRLNVTTQALDEAASKVTGYLTMQVIINVSFGVPIGAGLYFMGLPNAALWGLLATLLRFVPYVGAWIALAFPLLISLATTDTWKLPLEILALFGGIELITSNVLEPWLYGAHTGLSPVAIMVATIFWTWLWGGVGLLLATPLTVCVAVLGKYIPSLAFLDALLGDEPTLTPEKRYYQRLLALDRREATQVAEAYLKENSLAALYSTLLVPALAAEEREDQNGGLDERHQRFIFDATREMVEELGGQTLEGLAAKTGKGEGDDAMGPSPLEAVEALVKHPVFCLPAADEADEIVAVMLTQLLEQEGYKAESVSFKTLANEMVEQVAAAGCATVCISATPPHDTLHTRYLCKLLRARFPSLYIVVGLWDAEQGEEKLARRRERLTADKVVTTLQGALEEIRPFAVLESAPTAETA
jgi:predicted PurR-regulated permease PerM